MKCVLPVEGVLCKNMQKHSVCKFFLGVNLFCEGKKTCKQNYLIEKDLCVKVSVNEKIVCEKVLCVCV